MVVLFTSSSFQSRAFVWIWYIAHIMYKNYWGLLFAHKFLLALANIRPALLHTPSLWTDFCYNVFLNLLMPICWDQGSSRSSILGEACINLADYAEALKPSIVALPLHGCDSGTILHVRPFEPYIFDDLLIATPD